MRKIKFTKRFKRDFRREKSGKNSRVLDKKLNEVLDFLERDETLPYNYFDHALTGKWSDHRDCHIRPNLVLIYRKPNATTLQLVRLGSHSELGL